MSSYRTNGILGLLGLMSIAFVSVSTARADVAVRSVETGARTTLELAEKIALSSTTASWRLAQAEVIERLGMENGQALIGIVRSLKAQQLLPTHTSDWAQLRKLVEAQEGATATDALALLRKASDRQQVLTSQVAQQFFASRGQVAIADLGDGAAESVFFRSVPPTPEAASIKEALTASASRAASARIQTIGRLLSLAQKTPALCSLENKAYCQEAANKAIWLWVLKGIDKGGEPALAFLSKVLSKFPGEIADFTEEQLLRGTILALSKPVIAEPLQSCFFSGKLATAN